MFTYDKNIGNVHREYNIEKLIIFAVHFLITWWRYLEILNAADIQNVWNAKQGILSWDFIQKDDLEKKTHK